MCVNFLTLADIRESQTNVKCSNGRTGQLVTMSGRVKSKIFAKLESILKEKFPAGLDQIIESAGFDTETAIISLKAEDIKSIESLATANKSILKSTAYEVSDADLDNVDFQIKLKPGHVNFILNLPKILQEKKEKQKNKSKKIRLDEDANETVLDDDKLKEKLMNKVINFYSKNSYQLICDANSISEFTTANHKTTCRFSCAFCSKKLKCDYIKYWNISNFEAHLKVHFKKLIEDSILEPNESNRTNSENIQISNYSDEHEKALEDLLGNDNSVTTETLT